MNYNYSKWQILALLFFFAAVFFAACTLASGLQLQSLAENYNALVEEHNACVEDYNYLTQPRPRIEGTNDLAAFLREHGGTTQ